MRKFLAIVKREYVQRVRSKMFLVVTVAAPLMFALFTVAPAFIAGIKSGGPTRVAVVDETGRMYEEFQRSSPYWARWREYTVAEVLELLESTCA